jgi:hypothetical protein
MSKELHSIQKQIAETKDNLRRIDERIAAWVEPTQVPLQLQKDKDKLQELLDELQEREQSLRAEPGSKGSDRLPPLLTYDLDRSLQEFELGQKLEELGASSPKPVICLIHGQCYECHDKFIDCLEKSGLRRLLNLKSDLAPYRVYIPKWPSQINELDNFDKRYCKSLADQTLEYSRASRQEINDWLAGHPEPVIIESEFSTRNWEKHAARVINKVLAFWQGWPQLAPNQVLLVCLCIKYPIQRRSLFSKVFAHRPISEVAADALQKLAHRHKNQIILAVLPTLQSITQQQAEDWVRTHESDLISRYGEDVIDALKATIRSIYEQCQSREDPKRIPMEDLTHQLRSILRQHEAQEFVR